MRSLGGSIGLSWFRDDYLLHQKNIHIKCHFDVSSFTSAGRLDAQQIWQIRPIGHGLEDSCVEPHDGRSPES
jgi:hypothetical protein